jgi:hypothetical protein
MTLPKPYIHTDGRVLMLGKGAARKDQRDLKLKDFLTPTPAPAECNWYGPVTQWGMMLNDSLGDCTCAAVGHGLQVATLNTPIGEITPVDDAVLGLYEKACGYIPGDPSTDQGGDINTVLNSTRTTGLGKKEVDGHTRHHFPLYAYAAVDETNIEAVKLAIATLGVCDIGLQLPISAQAQVGGVWDMASGPNGQAGSWGGHSVVVCAYDVNGLTCITWGALQRMTWAFWNAYVDEAFSLFYNAWKERSAPTSGVQFDAFDKALQAVTA